MTVPIYISAGRSFWK